MASQSYLIVSCPGDQDEVHRAVAGQAGQHLEPQQPICDFTVPQGALAPKFGSFDNLIRLTDELQKHDSQIEGCLRRVERQWLETDENADFQVISQGQSKSSVSVGQFLKEGWKWDEAKYPPQRSLQANLDFLLDRVQKIDEDCRNKGQDYSDMKGQKAALTKRDGVTFPTRDLVDLITPEIVKESDFVETEHLTTVVVILARGQDNDFLAWYQNPSMTNVKMDKDGNEVKTVDSIEPPQTVIPGSAQMFKNFPEGAEDKDGNTIWRVVLFKSCKDKFASLARQNKFIVRDFEYSAGKSAELNKKRVTVDAESKKALGVLTEFCKMAWSDIFTAWLHIKSMRCFVENVLRSGVDSKIKYAGLIIVPKVGEPKPLREALFQAMTRGRPVDRGAAKAEEDGEEYFPYVSMAMAPRAAQLAA